MFILQLVEQFAYFQDPENPEYKAPRNVLFNIPRVFTPEDKAIQTPNSDTPYSWIGMDLRAEPLEVDLAVAGQEGRVELFVPVERGVLRMHRPRDQYMFQGA